MTNTRRALRIQISQPAAIVALGQPDVNLHPSLAEVYERVEAARQRVGDRLPGVLRDLSTNGAFVAAEPLPLLSRVSLNFELEDHGSVEALGWVLWRRTGDCTLPRDDGSSVLLPRGFGVLFEAIPLEARLIIQRMVERAAAISA